MKVRETELDGMLYDEIILINLKTVNAVIEKNSDIFFSQSEKKIDSERVFSILEDSIYSENKEIAKGILFGFGEKNARYYALLTELLSTLASMFRFPEKHGKDWYGLNKDCFAYFLNQGIYNQKKDFSPSLILKKYESFQQNRKCLNDIYPEGPLTMVPLPGFIAREDFTETHELHKSFYTTQKELVKILQSPNFLKILLEKFTEGAL